MPEAPMPTVGIFEAKNRLSELIDRVIDGETITITRRGQTVARLVPTNTAEDAARARAAIEALRVARKGARLGGDSIAKLRRSGRR